MSIITPDNLIFTPTLQGMELLTSNKPLPVTKVALIGANGFESVIKATAESQTKRLAVSFESDFMGDFPVRKLILRQDDRDLGTVTREVEGIAFDIFTLQQGFVYIAGMAVDFIKEKTTLTINRYKGSLASPNCDMKSQSLAMVDTILQMIGEKQAESLISEDKPNDLILGSDNKLLVQASSNAINRYQHIQTTPATQWVINHNLGIQPQISVLSLGGMLMLAEILHTSTNQAIIYFDNPTAGIANCI